MKILTYLSPFQVRYGDISRNLTGIFLCSKRSDTMQRNMSSINNKNQPDGLGFTSFYSDGSIAANNNQFYHPLVILQHQKLIDRHRLCLIHLQKTAKEAESLRQENTNLKVVNRDLNKRLSLFAQASFDERFVSASYSSELSSAINDLRRLGLTNQANGANSQYAGGMERVNSIDRMSSPKRISVRSNGYVKTMSKDGESSGLTTHGVTRIGSQSPVNGTVP